MDLLSVTNNSERNGVNLWLKSPGGMKLKLASVVQLLTNATIVGIKSITTLNAEAPRVGTAVIASFVVAIHSHAVPVLRIKFPVAYITSYV